MKKFTPQEALSKIQRYCAYQERSHREVRQKLFEYRLNEQEADELIVQLITSDFLNEERYARALAGGKFRIKKWGRLKIIQAMEAQGLSQNCMNIGLTEIDQRDYEETLKKLLVKKDSEIEDENIYTRRDKLSKFAIAKGYEPDLVWSMIKD